MKNKKIINGVTASPGRASGQVLIIEDPMKAPNTPKHNFIVVAEYTTPILNLLLMKAKAIVCETGGVTMHASVISRELGTPCIVNVKGIMQAVVNKQNISIDADKGEIYV